jgi:hypothetical protein
VKQELQRLGQGVLRETNLGSPVAVMNHYLNRSSNPLFAKIDNDIIVPDWWLNVLADVMDAHPQLELLGMEAGMSGVPPHPGPLGEPTYGYYSYEPCTHIGGVGLMRRSAFESRGYPNPDGRFGFTEWQHEHNPVAGWIKPDLLQFALDLLPIEPWRSITDGYKKIEGLQRDWPRYDWWIK